MFIRAIINNSFAQQNKTLVYLSDYKIFHGRRALLQHQQKKNCSRKFFFLISAQNQPAPFKNCIFPCVFLVWLFKDDGVKPGACCSTYHLWSYGLVYTMEYIHINVRCLWMHHRNYFSFSRKGKICIVHACSACNNYVRSPPGPSGPDVERFYGTQSHWSVYY